ncbi:hypothetical protein PN290_03910 [Romboutsia sp. 1001216sp1]|nr:hypothetical protein [Romboutsia sp. 1001216sp1]MDB8798517.1 hypothetical protein [Romboutsia sp. 1001216sp1]
MCMNCSTCNSICPVDTPQLRNNI